MWTVPAIRRKRTRKPAKGVRRNADNEAESLNSFPASVMRTKTARRKHEAGPAVVATAPGAPSPARPVIVLASNCNVKDAAALKQSLCRHLDDAGEVTLDIRKVERVDTSTMQLLCAFVRDRLAQRRKVEWLGDSQVLREAARLLGVEPLLALPPSRMDPTRNGPEAAT